MGNPVLLEVEDSRPVFITFPSKKKFSFRFVYLYKRGRQKHLWDQCLMWNGWKTTQWVSVAYSGKECVAKGTSSRENWDPGVTEFWKRQKWETETTLRREDRSPNVKGVCVRRAHSTLWKKIDHRRKSLNWSVRERPLRFLPFLSEV